MYITIYIVFLFVSLTSLQGQDVVCVTKRWKRTGRVCRICHRHHDRQGCCLAWYDKPCSRAALQEWTFRGPCSLFLLRYQYEKKFAKNVDFQNWSFEICYLIQLHSEGLFVHDKKIIRRIIFSRQWKIICLSFQTCYLCEYNCTRDRLFTFRTKFTGFSYVYFSGFSPARLKVIPWICQSPISLPSPNPY